MTDHIKVIAPQNMLIFRDKTYHCVLGKAGYIAEPDKREGDNKTPLGVYPVRKVFYRADKIAAPKTVLPTHVITQKMGWCDASNHPSYNQLVGLPFTSSHEKMWRDDVCYDLLLTLGHNDTPAVAAMGSAIFMHVKNPNGNKTEGCVALEFAELLEIIEVLSPDSMIEIVDK